MKRIIAYGHYYTNFYNSLSHKEKDKVDRIMMLMQSCDRMPTHFIAPVIDGIFELRISVPNKELRILFIYDNENIVILLNCFVKKTEKTPRSEITKAIRIKKQYYDSTKK